MAAPQHYAPPSTRELRAQAVQRLQSGLFGIAAIVLIVGLANIINDRARLADASARPQVAASSSTSSAGSDPLAEVGVVPSQQPDAQQHNKPAANAAAVPAGTPH
ncbi:MAG: hypothetical protein ACKOOL_01155 [Novosphingobium sp.]